MTTLEPLRPPQDNKILIVDDEYSNRDIMSQFLAMEGFQLFMAVDGEDAMQKLQEVQPDLVLLDILMPRLNGYEVCRRIKDNPETVFVPVIMITALRGTDEKIKSAEVGADDFLTKPFNYIELVTRVKSLLRVKQLSDQLKDYNRQLEKKVQERTLQLRRALEELREIDRLKSEFIANVSHELRTPLLHVKGYVSLMADGTLGPLTSDQQDGLRTAEGSIQILEKLVEDIVDFSGTDVNQLEIGPVIFSDVLRVTQALLQRSIQRSSAKLVWELPDDLPAVRADRRALVRVMQHLLDNALKFSPQGGTVTVIARRQGDKVQVVVKDEGVGIQQNLHERIFDTFYQVDGSPTRRFGGTGIGLAVVKRILDAHGSSVKLISAPGKGSTFWFELPILNGK
ncbi:MAG TPA: response regulator [Anaerolineales bacterium]|nr:response regulator [Anaerolineales bacterium]